MAGSRIGTMVPICPPRGALVNLFAHGQKLPPSWGTLVELNMARRHLNQEQRRGLIQAELKDRPQVSDNRIAKSLGVSQPTVSAVRKDLENSGELIKVISSIGADGKERPRQVSKPAPEPARHVSLFSAAPHAAAVYTEVVAANRRGGRRVILSISDAARAAGINRRTLQRAIQTGRLSATTDTAGGRGVDLAELIRAFGPLKEAPQEEPHGQGAAMSQETAPHTAPDTALVDTLREQVQQVQDQLHHAQERETRLLTLLETAQQVLQAEQQARRDLETRLLPAPPPRPAPAGKGRLWALVILLVAALAFAGWRFREMIIFPWPS